MSVTINQMNADLQEQSKQIESYVVFRFSHQLGKGIKSRIKSLGCSWSVMFHGWICPLSRQEEVKNVIQEAKISFDSQPVSLPVGYIPHHPKIAGRQSRLEILEEQVYKEGVLPVRVRDFML